MRVAALAEIHGNIQALEAVLASIEVARPDLLLVGGGFVLDGCEPAAVVDTVRELEEDGALVVSGVTDLVVADFDLGAAPSYGLGPTALADAVQWAHEALGPERVDWLRRLPSERRTWVDDTMLLWTQAVRREVAPDSTLRAKRTADLATDAKVVCVAMDHVASVRRQSGRLIVNVGSVGWGLGGDPRPTWAMLDFAGGTATATIHRVTYDNVAAATAIEARGLPGDLARTRALISGLRG